MDLMNRNCAICGIDNSEEVYRQPFNSIVGLGNVNYVHKISICKKCGLVYTNPIPSPHIISQYYRNLSNYENPQREGKASQEHQNKWKRTYDFIKKRFPNNFKGKAIEIGCATACGLSFFKAEGWDVLGIDPSPKAAELAMNIYGIEVITGMFDINLLGEENKFDLIILSHVVEHLISPDLLISELIKILSPDGLIYIEVPNLLCPNVPMGWFMFEHLFYFTPTTLTCLMGKNGFCEDHLITFDTSPDIEPFYPVIACSYKKSTENYLKIRSDYDAAYNSVKTYKMITGKEIERLQMKIDYIVNDTESGKLGIWGAGLHTSQLFSLTNLPKESISCIFDSDSKKDGKLLNDLKVISSNKTPQQLKEMVDAIIISSKAFENEIYDQIRYLNGYGIKIHKLYDNL